MTKYNEYFSDAEYDNVFDAEDAYEYPETEYPETEYDYDHVEIFPIDSYKSLVGKPAFHWDDELESTIPKSYVPKMFLPNLEKTSKNTSVEIPNVSTSPEPEVDLTMFLKWSRNIPEVPSTTPKQDVDFPS